MSDERRPRDYWMCGNPGGCQQEPLWVPLNQERPYCREHDRRYERLSDIVNRAGSRAATIGRRGRGGPEMPRRR
jgi:hypothetical protein